ncbi:MAG: hypothetical protein IT373_11125 [Polyangiaceae bacterium]|nr:hypothetical protein [Polyangiaceae bacterium]
MQADDSAKVRGNRGGGRRRELGLRVAVVLTGLASAAALGACGGPGKGGPEPLPPTGEKPKITATATAAASANAALDAKATDLPAGVGDGRADAPRPEGGERPEHGVGPGQPPGPGEYPPPPPPEPVAPLAALPDPGAFQPGDAVAYLPRDCRHRIYVNVAALVGAETAKVGSALDKLLATIPARDHAPIEQALRMLRQKGLDPVTTVREVAACDGPDVTVLGLRNDASADVLALVQRLMQSFGAPAGTVERAGSLTVLATGEYGPTVAQLGASVLAIADHRNDLLAALGARAGAASWGGGRHLLAVSERDMDVTLDEQAPNLLARGVIHLDAGDVKEAPEIVKKIQGDVNDMASEAARTPFKLLAPRLRATKVAVSGHEILVTASLPRSDVAALLQVVLATAPADLERAMPWYRQRDSAAAPPPPPPLPPPPPPRP